MKIYQIHDDIYNHHFCIITDISCPDLKKYINKKFPGGKLEVDDGTQGLYFYTTKDDIKYYFLWLPKFNWTIKEQAILSHELIHHLTNAFETKNIKMSDDNTEVMAYYWEYIFKKVWTALQPKHHKYKKKKK